MIDISANNKVSEHVSIEVTTMFKYALSIITTMYLTISKSSTYTNFL